ncbi:hypothetical protein BDN72DRAFT_146397 [Pluteus cervinus]|uniref:Uncharacterized protein n=1 Tax=Pluteus cervinus TaxID=181527 RepID=A0ACD3ALX2_9AGAR|nr:hypothetical protein BDN72DRAFT_146397 [Pluteus cervinus]
MSGSQGGSVQINWVFIDPSSTNIDPTSDTDVAYPLSIPKSHFEKNYTHVLEPLADKLSKYYKIKVRLADIRLWKPKTLVTFDDMNTPWWNQAVSALRTSFHPIQPADRFDRNPPHADEGSKAQGEKRPAVEYKRGTHIPCVYDNNIAVHFLVTVVDRTSSVVVGHNGSVGDVASVFAMDGSGDDRSIVASTRNRTNSNATSITLFPGS